MNTRDDYREYDDIPEISDINCFIDRTGYFTIEANFGGADYAYLSYNFEEDEYLVEDPYIGVVVSTPDLNQAVDEFCEFYKVSPEDCQYIHSNIPDDPEYVRSDTGITYHESRKKMAADLADEIMEWQDSLVGPAFLSDALSEEDIITLDKARSVLYRYSES